MIITRCEACGELGFLHGEEACDLCGYTPTCAACGTDIDPDDYDAEQRSACSYPCHTALRAEEEAERGR